MKNSKRNRALIASVAFAAFTLLPTTVIADGTSSVSVGPQGFHATTTTTNPTVTTTSTTTTEYHSKSKHHGKSKKYKLNDNGHNGNNGRGYKGNNGHN